MTPRALRGPEGRGERVGAWRARWRLRSWREPPAELGAAPCTPAAGPRTGQVPGTWCTPRAHARRPALLRPHTGWHQGHRESEGPTGSAPTWPLTQRALGVKGQESETEESL